MRLLSYNIHKGIGGRDRAYRLERIIEVIRHEKPQVVCLQEVDRHARRSSYDDQPAVLSRELRLEHLTFQFNHRVERETSGRGGYGNLILSAYPLRERHNVSLRYRGRKNRRAQVAVIETPHGPVRVVNWHLGLGDAERHWQVARLLEDARYCAYAGMPTLIAGDFNDWRNTLQAGALAQHALSQVTAPISRFRSFPAYMPVGALDKAFCCDRVRIQRAHIVKSALAARASDHLPLVIDLELA